MPKLVKPKSHHFHAVVWIDHREARVFHFNADDVENMTIRPEHPTRHLHHRAGSIGDGHEPMDPYFFRAVAAAIGEAQAVLIVGPGLAKSEFVKHLHRHDADLLERIAGIESSDHPSDGKLVDHARAYFRAADRMSPQLA
jgi:hypothetical protein